MEPNSRYSSDGKHGSERMLTTQCLSNDDLYDINPKYSMNVENFIEKSMLCIVVDNSPSDGSFYKDPGTLTAQTFCDSDISPEYAFTNNGRTCSGSSERYTFSSLNNKFRAGEAIPLAHADNVGSLSLSMGGFLSIPVAGQSGSSRYWRIRFQQCHYLDIWK